MSSRRVLKAAEAIREVVGMAILTQLRDPRIQDVTVTYVEVSSDMRLAKVHVSVMGDEKKQNLSLHGLQNAAGFLQQRVATRIDTRYTPKLRFVLDPGVKNSIEVSRILQEVLPREGELEESAGPEEDAARTSEVSEAAKSPRASTAEESPATQEETAEEPAEFTPDEDSERDDPWAAARHPNSGAE